MCHFYTTLSGPRLGYFQFAKDDFAGPNRRGSLLNGRYRKEIKESPGHCWPAAGALRSRYNPRGYASVGPGQA